MGCIYKETNTINGKCYIGLSTGDVVKTRHRNHMNGKGGALLLERAVAKHGRDAFVLEFLHDGILLLDELERLEVEEIAKHNCQTPNAYNIEPGGNVPPSRKGATPWNKGKTGIYSDEALQKMSEASKNRQWSSETRLKISKIMKELWANPDYRQQHSERLREANRDPKRNQKISESLKGNSYTLGMDPWNKGKTGIYSDETLQKMSEAKTHPDKAPAREVFLSLPDSMCLREKRKILIDTFPERAQATIREWVREWIKPTPSQLNLFG